VIRRRAHPDGAATGNVRNFHPLEQRARALATDRAQTYNHEEAGAHTQRATRSAFPHGSHTPLAPGLKQTIRNVFHGGRTGREPAY
jgi:hypothetical protein